MREREAFEHGGAVGVFGIFGFEEFAPCGGVEKQVGHFHGGAFGMGGGGNGRQDAVFGADFVAVRAAGSAAGKGKPADGGDAGQPFTAETHAGNVFQIGKAGDFAGGVPGERERQVVGMDAASVVAHEQAFDAAAVQFHLDFGRPRVYAVFDDFLQGIGGAFHHLSGGDLVD